MFLHTTYWSRDGGGGVKRFGFSFTAKRLRSVDGRAPWRLVGVFDVAELLAVDIGARSRKRFLDGLRAAMAEAISHILNCEMNQIDKLEKEIKAATSDRGRRGQIQQ